MDFMNYIIENALILIPVLYILGSFLKGLESIKDKYTIKDCVMYYDFSEANKKETKAFIKARRSLTCPIVKAGASVV